jgi:hypothetical protein
MPPINPGDQNKIPGGPKRVMRDINELGSVQQFKTRQVERLKSSLTPTTVNHLMSGNAKLATIKQFSADQASALAEDLQGEESIQMFRDISRLQIIRENVIRAANLLAQKLNEEIERGYAIPAFSFALLLAAFKDYFDIIWDMILVALQGIPVVGQILFVIAEPLDTVVDLFLATFLFFFMLHKGYFIKTKIKLIFWVLTALDLIPGADLLPLESFAVMWAYHVIQIRASRAELKLKKLDQLTQKEIENLNTTIELLDEEESI